LPRLDPAARTLVDASGECISLRRSEFELLLAFASKPGRALSRDYLLEAVASRPSEAFDRSIDVLVGRLRRKIEREPRQPKLIITVPGIGYRFAATPRSVRHDVLQAIVAPRLSIVVLPFANLSNDPEQGYLVDGVTDDLTSDLSRIPESFVISRSTAFTYKGKQVGAKEIGRELGVRYLLEGSVRRSGGLVRVNVQLIDTESGAHLWVERFDRDISDLLRLQDEITRRTAVAVGSELVIAEASRPTDHPDALDYFFRARAAWSKPPTRQNYAEVINLFERALALDSRSAEIQSWLARALVARVFEQLTDSVKSVIGRAEALVEQALAASRVVRLRITPGATCCVRKAGTRKLLPNTRL